MNSPLGVQVFPTESSQAVLRSPNLLHFSPVPDPPIDYTIKEKSKQRPDYSVTLDVFRKEWSPDFEQEEDPLRTPLRPRRARIEKRWTQAVGEGRMTAEMEMVLDDLNLSLESEGKLRSGDEPHPSKLRRRQSLERVKSLAAIGQQAQIAPVMKAEVIEDLRRVAKGQDVSSVNENRRRIVTDRYEKTRKLIDDARNTYNIQYFLPKYESRGIPAWQKQLLAVRASREALRQYEEKAWANFDEWKKRCAPQIQLRPDYRFATRPTLF